MLTVQYVPRLALLILPPEAFPQACTFHSAAKYCLPTRHCRHCCLPDTPNSVTAAAAADGCSVTPFSAATAKWWQPARRRGACAACKADVDASEQGCLRYIVWSWCIVCWFTSKVWKPIPTLHRPSCVSMTSSQSPAMRGSICHTERKTKLGGKKKQTKKRRI